ncbi:hypothetical protein MMC15_007370, partial [Xylographa vitiligo]|nr:hypothetical protein [Xylographa vitiligo]
MKILESQSATLTNAEVLTHLLSPPPPPSTTTTSKTTPPLPPLKAPNYETVRAAVL